MTLQLFVQRTVSQNLQSKQLTQLMIEQSGLEISILISAKSFLHNQVRSIAGSLKLVGEGKWESLKDKRNS